VVVVLLGESMYDFFHPNNSCMAKQKIQTTIIGSINIQSAKGNSKYLENILNTCDILCIQPD
jgi:hypothetical protein